MKFVQALLAAAVIASAQVVEVDVTTSTYTGHYGPDNVLAAWVETGSGNFVSMISACGLVYINHLVAFLATPSLSAVQYDAVASATRPVHGPLSLSWDCTDSLGVAVPDGQYRFRFEFTENNSATPPAAAGPLCTIPFVKGGVDSVVTVPDVVFVDSGVSSTVYSNVQLRWYAAGPGEVRIASDTYAADENTATALVTVERLRGEQGAVSALVTVSGASATDGTDFVGGATTVSFADGEMGTKTVAVPLVNDALVEGDESCVVALSSVSGAATGSRTAATLLITDDDSRFVADSLEAWWSFEETGSFAVDRSVHGHHGISYSSRTVNGPFNSARRLSIDSSEMVAIPGDGGLACTGPVSVAMWVNPKTLGVTQNFMSAGSQYIIWVNPTTGKVRFADANGHYLDIPSSSLTAGQWNHLVAVFSGTSGTAVNASTIQMYVNGVAVGGTASGTWTPAISLDQNVVLGGSGFVGSIDEVYMFRRGLSAAEVQRLYAWRPPVPSALGSSPIAGLASAVLLQHGLSLQLFAPSSGRLVIVSAAGRTVRDVVVGPGQQCVDLSFLASGLWVAQFSGVVSTSRTLVIDR